MTDVRVRFAPSPTGPLHIGGVRTALYNYLFAKKMGGKFILRIEDTDQNRYVAGAEKYIVEALNWCGIHFDEGDEFGGDYGPYKQSDRKSLYKDYVDTLLANKSAYLAFDTNEELDAVRDQYQAEGKTFIYNWGTRNTLRNSLSLTTKEVDALLKNNTPFVVRFKTPENEKLLLNDLIRGNIIIDTNTLDDKVLFKSDGMPTYHLANIVDDHLMKISHVIRGEEWLPSMALHILLYQAFGWSYPQFAHLPLILKPEGKGKLSKRDGDKAGFPVFPIEWGDLVEKTTSKGYREEGYLPQAVINMLLLLGWNEGTAQEIYSIEQMVDAFEIEKISKSGARFNPEKAIWFNHQYIQKLDLEALTMQFENILIQRNIKTTHQYNQQVVTLIKERINFVQDLWTQGFYFYETPTVYEPKALQKVFNTDAKGILMEIIAIISCQDFSQNNLETTIKGWITAKELGFGKVMQPLRLALVGSLQGSDVFVLMQMLGKDEVIKRLNNFLTNPSQ